MKNLILIAVIFGVSCRGPYRKTIMGYTITPSERDAGEMRRPEEVGGEIRIGANASKPGHPASQATTVFNCGNVNNCKISISVGGKLGTHKTDFVDNEEVTVAFSWAGGGFSTDTYGTKESYPQQATLPTCGPITITISMTEGDTPGIQSPASVAPVTYYCE